MAENFCRLIQLFTTICAKVLREFLQECWQQAGCSDLHELLNKEIHKLYHCFQPRDLCCCEAKKSSSQPSLTKAQWDTLYKNDVTAVVSCTHVGKHPCHFRANPGIRLEDLDISLLRVIIVKICSSLNSTESSALETIRRLRNDLMHPSKVDMNRKEFELKWFPTKKAILDLTNKLQKEFREDVQREIDVLETKSIDDSECKRILEVIKHLKDTDTMHQNIFRDIEGVKHGLDVISKGTEESYRSLHQDLGNISRTTNSVQQSNATLQQDISQISGDISDVKQCHVTMQDKMNDMKSKVEQTQHQIERVLYTRDAKHVPRSRSPPSTYDADRQQKLDHLIRDTNLNLRYHKKNKAYVPFTRAEKVAYEKLAEFHQVTLSGREGCGKTSMAKQLMLIFCDQHSGNDGTAQYRPVILRKPEEFDLISCTDHLLIFLDDPFGGINSDDCALQKWKQYFDAMISFCQEGHIRIIFGIRSYILKECHSTLQKCSLFLKKKIVDMSSEFMMTSAEKMAILKAYCLENNVYICDGIIRQQFDSTNSPFVVEKSRSKLPASVGKKCMKISRSTLVKMSESDPFVGFPQSCFLFFSVETLFHQGIDFFTHADESLLAEISGLRKKQPLQYFALSYMLLEGGVIDTDNLEEDKVKNLNALFKTDYLTADVRECIQYEISKAYVKKVDNLMPKPATKYTFTHMTIQESILLSFCNRYPEFFLKYGCDYVIHIFTRPSGYRSRSGEICVKIDKKFHGLLAQRLVRYKGFQWIPSSGVACDELFVEDILDAMETTDAPFYVSPFSRKYTDKNATAKDKTMAAVLHDAISRDRYHLVAAICSRYVIHRHSTDTYTQSSAKPKLYLKSFLQALNYILKRREVGMVEKLLQSNGVDLTRAYKPEQTLVKGTEYPSSNEGMLVPLVYAADDNLKCLVTFIIDTVETTTLKDHLRTLLANCCRHNWVDVTKKLLAKGKHSPDLDLSPSSFFPFVTKYFRKNMVAYLLQFARDTDLTFADDFENTLFHYCAKFGWKSEVLKIVQLHPGIVTAKNQDGMTGIFLAAGSGHKEIVQELLQQVTDLSTEDNHGNTLIHFFAANDWDDVIYQHVMDPSLLSCKNENGFSPFHISLLCCSKNVVKLMFPFGFDPHHEKLSCVEVVSLGMIMDLQNVVGGSFINCGNNRSRRGVEDFIDLLNYILSQNKDFAVGLSEQFDQHGNTVVHYMLYVADTNIEGNDDVSKFIQFVLDTYSPALHTRARSRLPTTLHVAAYVGRYKAFVKLYEAGVRCGDGDLSIMDTLKLGLRVCNSNTDWSNNDGPCQLQRTKDFCEDMHGRVSSGYQEIKEFCNRNKIS